MRALVRLAAGLAVVLALAPIPAGAWGRGGRAAAAPEMRLPVVFLPGLTGTKMENDPQGDGSYAEVWPNAVELLLDWDDDSLLVLGLAGDGRSPAGSGPAYASVRAGAVLTQELVIDFYQSTIDYFTQQAGYTLGVDFLLCPYDWRKSLDELAFGDPQDPAAPSLEACVQQALALNPGAAQVNLLAHSMGGLVARAYLSDPAKAAHVSRLVTLGSPLLGAPKITLALLDRLCFVEWSGICFSHPDTLHTLVQNFPAAYEISPSDGYFEVYPQGFLRRDWDRDGDGQADGVLDPDESSAALAEHNPALAGHARALLSGLGGWGNGGTHGVQVYSFVGDGFESGGRIIEYLKRPWYRPWGLGEVRYRLEPANGDGTAPLRSADTRDPSRGVDLSGDATVYYFNLEHGALARSPETLALAAGIFAGEAPAPPAAPQASPRTEPAPLSGRRLWVEGPVAVEVFNPGGDHIGAINDGGAWEATIPGASLDQAGESAFIFLPTAGGPYTILLHGLETATVDVRIQKIEAGEVVQTDLYDDLPVQPFSLAQLDYDPLAAQAGSFLLTGWPPLFPPTASLDAAGSADWAAPRTTITLSGTAGPGGWLTGAVQVSLAAADNPGGTGVARIEYSLDGGATVQTYAGPFSVDASLGAGLLVKATDRAGNEEAPLAAAQIGPRRVFLPVLAGP